MRSVSLVVALSALALFGFGCTLPKLSVSSNEVTGPKTAKFDGLSPEQAAKKIVFVGGNSMVMKQGFGGIGGDLARKLGFGGNEGTRNIVIQNFAPGNTANIEWKLTTTVEKDAADKNDSGIRQTTGRILDAKLRDAHKLYLPGFWAEGEKDAFDTSVIWVSQDVYENLQKGSKTDLDLGVLDSVITKMFPGAQDVKAALAKIQAQVDLTSARKDANLMEADPERSTYTLKINGKDVTVQTITARNWFGEVTVLDNPQNPLVLKVTLDPVALAAADATTGSSFLKNALGYQITELQDIQE